jgi:hypothetical protein
LVALLCAISISNAAPNKLLQNVTQKYTNNIIEQSKSE